MSAASWHLETELGALELLHDEAYAGAPVCVFAHGAGGHKADSGVEATARALRAAGLSTVRFDFFYRARGSKRPDAMPQLVECFRAVTAEVRRRLAPSRLFLGGRSMGGRAASVAVAEGLACDGLVLVAYPLHPPKQPNKLRTAHWPELAAPVLCFSGTRDEFCSVELFEAELERARRARGELVRAGRAERELLWRQHWLDGADHSLHVLKRSGRTDAEVLEELGASVETWLTRTPVS